MGGKKRNKSTVPRGQPWGVGVKQRPTDRPTPVAKQRAENRLAACLIVMDSKAPRGRKEREREEEKGNDSGRGEGEIQREGGEA